VSVKGKGGGGACSRGLTENGKKWWRLRKGNPVRLEREKNRKKGRKNIGEAGGKENYGKGSRDPGYPWTQEAWCIQQAK